MQSNRKGQKNTVKERKRDGLSRLKYYYLSNNLYALNHDHRIMERLENEQTI